jgi:hypothetical protein
MNPAPWATNTHDSGAIRPQGRAPTIEFCGYLSFSGNQVNIRVAKDKGITYSTKYESP